MPSGFRSVALWELLFGAVLCVAVYYPGLHGDFIFDDITNIVQNEQLRVDELTFDGLRAAAFSSDAGVLKRPVSMLTFWGNYLTAGLNPFYFKLTNLLIHLLNGIALFWLARLLARGSERAQRLGSAHTDGIAVAIALIWLLHPLNLTSVLYVVQRMTSLCATFTILGLLCYVAGRQRLVRGESGFPLIILGMVGFGTLAVLTKENGVLLPFYIVATELTLFRFSGLAAQDRRMLIAFFLLTAAFPIVAATVFLALDPSWLTQQYTSRDFTLAERLLTEPRVLCLYLFWVFVPTRAGLGLFHDDIPVSHSLLDPPTTILAIVAIIAASSAAILFRKRAPLFAFAVCWYLAGHALESSIIALELVHEHRNYLPMFGPLFAAVYWLHQISVKAIPRARFAVPALFALALSSVTLGRSLDWSDLQRLNLTTARDHPDSVRANYEAGTALGNVALRDPVLASVVYDDAKAHFERATWLDDSAVSPLFGVILLDASAKRPLDERSMDRLATRLASMRMRPTVIEPFRGFLEWITKGVVVVPEHLVVKLFESAIGNPTADHRTRAMLFSMLSGYFFGVAGNKQEAVGLALTAVEEDPEQPAHHISLANLALLLGNVELASRETEAAKRVDLLGRFALDIRRLSAALTNPGAEGDVAVSTDVASR
jgi:hypothetical protein